MDVVDKTSADLSYHEIASILARLGIGSYWASMRIQTVESSQEANGKVPARNSKVKVLGNTYKISSNSGDSNDWYT